MARAMGAESGDEIMSHLTKKRVAATLDPLPAGKWMFKRNRSTGSATTIVDATSDNMGLHFSLIVMLSDESAGIVTDSDQSPAPP